MEDKKRIILAVAIISVVLLAVLYSFFLNLFARTSELVVADPNATDSVDSAQESLNQEGGIPVEVTTQTVQSVVASLQRYESYSRTMSVEYLEQGQSLGTVTARVWVDGGWTRSSVARSNGVVEHAIVGDGMLWLWHDSGEQTYHGPATAATADLMQRLPTYEDVLYLDQESITDAGYQIWEGQPCIYVEAHLAQWGYVERYWISETSGLLMATETEEEGQVVYTMRSRPVTSPLEQTDGIFTLPNGTELHVPDT